MKIDGLSDIPDVDNDLRSFAESIHALLAAGQQPFLPFVRDLRVFFRPFHTSRNVSFLEPHKAVQFGLQPFKGFAPFPFRNRLCQTFFVHTGRNFQDIIKIYYGRQYGSFICT